MRSSPHRCPACVTPTDGTQARERDRNPLPGFMQRPNTHRTRTGRSGEIDQRTAVAGEAARLRMALLVHGINLIPEPGEARNGVRVPAGEIRARAGTRPVLHRYVPAAVQQGAAGAERRSARVWARPAWSGRSSTGIARIGCCACIGRGSISPPDRHLAHLRYVGPDLKDPAPAGPWSSPWPADDARPLVVVSLSTTFMLQEALRERCIDAVGSMPVRTLVTVGPALDPGSLAGAENVAVVRSAPHDTVSPTRAR